MKVPQKIKKIELWYDPAILLLGIYMKKTKTLTQNDIWPPMFIEALFTIAKIWKRPVPINRWMYREGVVCVCIYIYIYTHTHNRLLHTIKEMKSCHLWQNGWT